MVSNSTTLEAPRANGRTTTWKNTNISEMHKRLETPNWAPWLAASERILARRAEVFPEGQLLLLDHKETPIASLSTNRISWNGNPTKLTTWNDIVGTPATYEKTYLPDGNTLVLISMNIAPGAHGAGYAPAMIGEAKKLALELGNIDFVISSFRPLQYGAAKLTSTEQVDFADYCKLKRADGLPHDAWLRSLARNGMKPIKVSEKAVTINMSLEEFEALRRSYNSSSWKQINGKYECGECGSWQVDERTRTATYVEPNLYGMVWSRRAYPEQLLRL